MLCVKIKGPQYQKKIEMHFLDANANENNIGFAKEQRLNVQRYVNSPEGTYS